MKRIFVFLIFVLMIGWGPKLWAQRTPSPLTPFTRKQDPVIVPFDRLPRFLGKEVKKIRVYRFEKGQLFPIPFQIDEVDEDGDYHFSIKKKKKRSKNLNQIPNRLDPKDELVFQAKDLGKKAPTKPAKDEYILTNQHRIKASLVRELEVADPTNHSKAWVYINYEETPSDLSPIRYVNYNSETSLIQGGNYQFLHNAVHNSLIKLKMNDETWSPNFIDRLKLHFELKFLMGLIDYNHTEDRFDVKVLWFKEGPIRLLHVIRVTPNIAFGIKMPGANLQTEFYETFYMVHVVVDLILSPKYFFSRADFLVYYDFNPELGPFKVTGNDFLPDTLFSDGQISLSEKEFPRNHHFIWTLSQSIKSPLAMMLMATPYPELKDVTPLPRLFYVDRKELENKPENLKGCFGCIGFRVDTLPLKKGIYKFRTHYFFYSDYKPGDEKGSVNLVLNPLEIENPETKIEESPKELYEGF